MRKILLFIFFIFVVAVFFRNWFTLSPLSSGDWEYRFPEEAQTFPDYPATWNYRLGGGLGGNGTFFMGLETYFLVTTKFLVGSVGLPWPIVERIVWFWPFIAVSLTGSYYLARTVLAKSRFVYITPFIFLINSYALVVTGGGQMGVALAYALSPWVLGAFIRLHGLIFSSATARKMLAQALVAGIAISVQLLFDPRWVYLTLGAVGLYVVVRGRYRVLPKLVCWSIVSLVIAAGVNAYWILPFILSGKNPIMQLGAAYSSAEAVKFFSFADFSHALSLLHPNWPENIFGKVYFLQPEFLLVPLLAFSSLLFLRKTKDDSYQLVLYFGLLGLLGAFLSKGANPPFGNLYVWLFQHVPGFSFFRDSTKFYLYTVFSYSLLIPFALKNLSELVQQKIKRNWVIYAVVAVFLLFWVVTLREAVLGISGGTFQNRTVPGEYPAFKDFLHGQPEFFRTFWVPHHQRYGYRSFIHPPLNADELTGESSVSGVLKWLGKDTTPEQLKRWGVKYVILPHDTHGEFFVNDRKYSQIVRDDAVNQLGQVTWLTEVELGKIGDLIHIYEVPVFKRHFFWQESDSYPEVVSASPTIYTLRFTERFTEGVLIFSESFDSRWVLQIGESEYKAQRTEDGLNSFHIKGSSEDTAVVSYLPQESVKISVLVSVVSLTAAFVLLIAIRRKK